MPDVENKAARSVERLRLAEARLSRRRQTDCGPSETARAAMRFILERADERTSVTPRAIAEHLGVSSASVSAILDRLHAGGMISVRRNPDDGRSKLIAPLDRDADADEIDPMTARIRRMASSLSTADAELVARFLEEIADAVDQECDGPSGADG